MKKRLFGIAFFAVTHVVIGGIAVVANLLLLVFVGVVSLTFPSLFDAGVQQVFQSFTMTPFTYVGLLLLGLASLMVSLFIVKVGKGLWRLTPWAQKAMLVYAGLVVAVIATKSILTIGDLAGLVFYGVAFVYFLLPKVAAQFSLEYEQVVRDPMKTR
ncbi:MAG: hypothetical protein ABH845_05430 [Candidatus Omnitrophota bacterium]